MRRFVVLLAILSQLLFLSGIAVSESEEPKTPKRKFRVMAVFVFSDEVEGSVQDQVKSAMLGELRSLGDVEIVETNPEYGLHVHTVSLKPVNLPMLYCASVTRYEFMPEYSREALFQGLLPLTADRGSEAGLALRESIEKKVYVAYLAPYCTYFGRDRIRSFCQGVVAAFDTDYLEWVRKAQQELNDILKSTPTQGEKRETR